jgi:chromate transporter
MNGEVLLQLIVMLAPLSLVAVGGALTIMPEIHRQVVEVYGWLSSAEFAELFTVAQTAPGPNLLVVSLIGWKVGGLLGALVALLAVATPSSLLVLGIMQVWRRLGNAPWLMAIQAGLAPIAIGLILAGGFILSSAAVTTLPSLLITIATVILLLRTRLHPLILMGCAAILALLGWL